MKKIDIGQAVTILANVGVIVGILLLAFELRQNNELMAAQHRFNRLATATGSLTLLAESSELASAVARFNDESVDIDALDLTPGERTQLSSFYQRVIQNQEWAFREIPEDQLPLEDWRTLAQQRSWRFHWDVTKSVRDSEFVEWIDENVVRESR